MKLRNRAICGSLFVALTLAQSLSGQSIIYWDGTSSSWNTLTNWSTGSSATTPDPSALPTILDDLIFNITTANAAQTITLDAAQTADSLTFNNTATTTFRANATGTTARTLTLGAGGITLSTGAGNVVLNDTPGTFGVLTVATGSTTQTWTNNATSLSVGPITGSGTLNLTGANSSTQNNLGQFVLDLSSYTGTLTVSNARLVNSVATNGFGTTGTLTINSGGQLGVNVANTTISRSLFISGNGWYDNSAIQRGAIRFLQTGTISSTVTLSGASRIVSDTGRTGTFSGRITGGFALEIGRAGGEAGTVTFSGGTANDYTGLTTVSSGTLSLSKTAGINSIGGNVLVTSGGTLSNAVSNQIADTATVTVDNTAAVWTLNTFTETIDTLNISGTYTAGKGFITGVAGKLTVNTLNVSGGGVTFNSAGAGNQSTITANTVTNTGGTWVFGVTNGTQSLVIGTGGLTIGGGSTMAVAAAAGVADNFISLGGNVTSQANAATNTISGTGTLRLNASRAFDVADGAAASDLTISTIVANGTGTGAVTKTGAGSMTLSGSNTYTGTTTVSAGTLSASNIVVSAGASNIGNATSAVTLGSASSQGVLSYTGNSANYTRGLTIGGVGGGRLNVTTAAQTLTVATGDVTGTGLFTVGGAGNTSISSNLIQTGGLTKVDAGTLTLSGTNTYNGDTTISSGTLSAANIVVSAGSSHIGNATSAVTLGAAGSQGILSYTGNSATYTRGFIIGGAGGGRLNVATAAQTLTVGTGGISGTGLLTIGGAGNTIINSALTHTGGVTKTDTGTLTLTGNNTFNGDINISNGNLVINNSSALGAGVKTVSITASLDKFLDLDSSISGGSDITLSSNISFSTSGVNGVIRNIAGNNTINGAFSLTAGNGNTKVISNGGSLNLAGNITINAAAGAVRTFDLDGTSTGANTVVGAISNGGGFVMSVAKNGSGTWTLAGANGYTGGTAINAGILKIGNATALGGNAAVATVTSGAVIDLNGITMTGTNPLTLNGTGISSGGALINSSATAGTYAGLLTLGSSSSIIAGSGNVILSNVGTITGTGFDLSIGGGFNTTISSIIGTGTGSLIKNDAGTLTLTAANTFSGGTTLNAGTLVGQVTGTSLTPTSPLGGGAVTLNAGILQLRASGALNTTAQTISFANNVTVAATTTIDVNRPGATSTTKTLALNNLDIGNSTLNVTGGNSYGLRFNGVTTLTGNATFNTTTSNLTLAGVINETGGSRSIDKTGSGILSLNLSDSVSQLASTFSGGVNILAGTLSLANTLGSGGQTTTPGGSASAVYNLGATSGSSGATLSINNNNISFNNPINVRSGSTGTKTFSIGGSSVTASHGGNITLNDDLTLSTAATSSTLTLNGVIGDGSNGAKGITVSGGVLVVTNTNTYTGTTSVNGGTLTATKADSLPGYNSSGRVVINGGTISVRILGTGWSEAEMSSLVSSMIKTSGNLGIDTTNDNFTPASSLNLGALGLVKNGINSLTLDQANSFTGGVTVNAGTLKIAHSSALGTGTKTLTSAGGSRVVQLSGGVTLANSISLSLSSNSGDGLGLSSVDGDNEIQGNINYTSGNPALNISSSGTSKLTLSGNLTYTVSSNTRILYLGGDSNASNLISGNLSQSGAGAILRVFKQGIGTWVLNGTNSYTGDTQVNDGVLSINSIANGGSNSSIGSSTSDAANLVFGGGTLLYTGSSAVSDRAFTVNASKTAVINVSSAATTLSLVGATGAATDGGLTKLGSGSLTLTGTNTYTGLTRVDEGTLSLGHAADTLADTGDVNVNGGTLALGANTDIVGNVILTSGSITGTTGSKLTGSSFDIRSGNISTELSGSGASLTKSTSGIVTLSAANTYTGATNVNAGKLVISSTGSTASGSAVTVANAGSEIVVDGTIGGTLIIGAGTTLSGSGTISGATTISGMHTPGNSPGVQTFTSDLTYASGSTVTWELGGNSNQNSPVIYDQLVVNGNLNFSGATTMNLSFSFLNSAVDWNNGFWDSDQSWVVYDVTGSTANFENLTLNQQNWLDSNSIALNAARSNAFFTLTLSGNDVLLNYTAVPETSVTLLGGLSALLMLRRRRAA